MKNIQNLRKKIDEIDKKILYLLKERFSIIRHIGLIKKKNDMPVKDEERIKEIYRKRLQIAKKYDIPKRLVKEIYKNLIHYSMGEEKKWQKLKNKK